MYKSNNNVSSGKLLNVQYNWTVNGVELIGNVPARLSKQEAAEMLGVREGDMQALKRAKLLMPCGGNHGKKRKVYRTANYSTQDLVKAMSSENFIDDMEYAISKYNAETNGRAKSKEG
jgi:hypothetical protein